MAMEEVQLGSNSVFVGVIATTNFIGCRRKTRVMVAKVVVGLSLGREDDGRQAEHTLIKVHIFSKLKVLQHRCLFIHSMQLGDFTRAARNSSPISNFSKIFLNGFEYLFTSIGMIMSHTCNCTCRKLCLSNACIGSEHSSNPI